MGFKGADGMFGNVTAVEIRGHELVCGLSDVSDVATVLLDGFFVEDLVVNDVATRLEVGHDVGVCRDMVAILVRLEVTDEDDYGVSMLGDHEVRCESGSGSGLCRWCIA